MNKKNLLFTLALPLLILSACGGSSDSSESKGSESSGDVISSESPISSESSNSEHAPYEVSDTEWNNVFSAFAKDYNATLFIYDSISKIDSSTLFLSKVLFDGEAAHVDLGLDSSSDSSDPNITGIETNVAKEYYYSRVGEKIYQYSPHGDSQYSKTEFPGFERTPWFIYDTIASYFVSSFSSFHYDDESNSYKADELSIEGNDYKVTGTTVVFSYGKLFSITGSYSGSYFRFTDIDITDVTLPGEDQIYIPGKVTKSFWESSLSKMSEELNCEYKVSYSYEDEYSSYYLEDVHKVAGDVMESNSRYEDHKNTSNNSSDHCYYSKEGEVCYKYSKSGDWYMKTSCTDYFKDVEDAILLFKDYYDSFTFYPSMSASFYGVYYVPSLAIAEKTYKEVYLTFGDKVPGKISYTSDDGYNYEISGFTCMEVTLPSENEIYREGKVTESEWKTAIEEAKDALDFRLVEVPVDDSSTSLSESVYLCGGNAIEYTYDFVSQSGDSVSEHAYYSLENSSYYTYKPKGDFWEKTLDSEDNPASSDCFSRMKECVEVFATHFSDFSFDIDKGAYAASSLTIGDSVYSDLAITFESSSLSKVEYTLDLVTYTINGFGTQDVTHPTDDDLYQKGKVKKTTWEDAFLDAASAPLNCSYSYSDGNIDYVLNISGDAIEKKIITNDLTTGKSTITTVYESKEGDAYYLYSESDSKWTKAEDEEVKKDFDAISSAIMLFSDNYDTLAYDKNIGEYHASCSTIDGTLYQDVRVCFDNNELSLIRWMANAAATSMIENFGSVSITLPTVEG